MVEQRPTIQGFSTIRPDENGIRRVFGPDGQPEQWHGVGLGGLFNGENFINGYPGSQHSLREELRTQLGPRKAKAFIEGLETHFFTEEDAKKIKEAKLDHVRLPLHSGMFTNRASGLTKVHNVIQMGADHGVRFSLDMHGGRKQNPDWHSDNDTPGFGQLWTPGLPYRRTLISDWDMLSSEFTGDPRILNYNILNEPATGGHNAPNNFGALNRLYQDIIRTIRKNDSGHIIAVDLDRFASKAYDDEMVPGKLLPGLEAPPDPNMIYSAHPYSPAMLDKGPYPGIFNGEYKSIDSFRRTLANHQATRFAKEHNVPLWAGEFGLRFSDQDRLRATDDQLTVFAENGWHWSYWTWKDVGIMGVYTLDPNSKYMRLISPILDKKRELHTDNWMTWEPQTEDGKALKHHTEEMATRIHKLLGSPEGPRKHRHHTQFNIEHAVLSSYAARRLQSEYVGLFADMSISKIDQTLQSFRVENCVPNQGLIDIFKKHTAST